MLLRRLFVKKQSYKSLFLKMAVIAALIVGGGFLFFSRFTFGYDGQLYKCIPGYSVYLIDKRNTELAKGNLYAFHSTQAEPVIKNGTILIKYLRGMDGDSVEIRNDRRIYINDEFVGGGFRYAEKLGVPEESFFGKAKLAGLWFMGTSIYSFDSRYWGTESKQQVIGRAYPLF